MQKENSLIPHNHRKYKSKSDLKDTKLIVCLIGYRYALLFRSFVIIAQMAVGEYTQLSIIHIHNIYLKPERLKGGKIEYQGFMKAFQIFQFTQLA